MPDISMCADKRCPKRNECYRFLATPHPTWQTWFDPRPKDGSECENFWQVTKKEDYMTTDEMLDEMFFADYPAFQVWTHRQRREGHKH